MAAIYQHGYVPKSMYGNVVALLRNCVTTTGVHLDIGCGFGAIAEPVRDELGLTYVGFDLATDGLDSLRERGFDVHQADLFDLEQLYVKIHAAARGRPVASLTFLDTLEHIVNGPATLAMFRRLAEQWAAPLVLSVPNITHKDIALKLLTGRWDVTEAGLLDYTHVDCYSSRRLAQLMAASGWREIEARDWCLEYSDQRFPTEAPTLDVTLPVGHLLRRLIDWANPHAIVNQFVRSYCIDQPKPLDLWHDRAEPVRPLVSIIVATQREPSCDLSRLLDNLVRQTNQDFELVLLHYPLAEADAAGAALVVYELPTALREKSVFVASPLVGLAGALNDALNRIVGHHLVILHADDEVEPQWLSTLGELHKRTPNSVLRVGTFESESGRDSSGSVVFPFTSDAYECIARFAVPGGAIRELGLRFDEGMTDGVEVEFIARAIMLCGMATSAVVAVSRQLAVEATLLAERRKAVTAAYALTLEKLNIHPLILPPGSVVELQRLIASDASVGGLSEQLVAAENSAQNFERQASHFRQEAEVGHRPAEFPMLRTFINRYILPDSQLSPPHTDAPTETPPFLSIITRTMGTRIRTLRDTLLTLAGQSLQDFELHLVIHGEAESDVTAVRSLVGEFPPTLQARIRVIQCTRPGRSAPLNDAIPHAKGRYVAVLDDDDFVFGHWVETFERLSREQPGAMLRAVCTRQDFEATYKGHTLIPRALSWFQMAWPSDYDAVDHLHANYSPFMSMAFPIAVFRKLNFRWDETVTTAEDWQFGTRIAMICGVVDTVEITGVYRWWNNGESSTFFHPPTEWQANRERILAELNGQPILLPKGSVGKICSLIDDNFDMRTKIVELNASNEEWRVNYEQLTADAAARDEGWRVNYEQLTADAAARDEGWRVNYEQLTADAAACDAKRDGLRHERDQLLSSTFWRLTAPARRVAEFIPYRLRFHARRVAKLMYWLTTPHRTRERIAFLKSRAVASDYGKTPPL
jgi:glycosyltransferase involved in cell wall biosynthesis